MASVAVHAPKTPVTKGSNSISAATIPNICKMPGPPAPFVPTPLPNIGKSTMSPKGYTTTVKVEGNPVAIKGASFKSMGDVASKGTGGGMVSMNVEGETKFIAPGSLTVKFQGKNVHLLGDIMSNNNGPSGSPPNAATMAGTIHAPSLGGQNAEDLKKLADECNRKTNDALGHCPGGPSGKDCTTAGTAKHKCCEEAIKDYNSKNPDSKLRSEVPFDANGNPAGVGAESAARKAANEAYHAAKNASQPTKGVWAMTYFSNGGAAFKADVLVEGENGFEKAYDFKFNCKSEGSKVMSQTQIDRYVDIVQCKPMVIHKDGRSC